MGEAKRRRDRERAAAMTPTLLALSRPMGADEAPARGQVSVAMILHDDWCAYFKGRECTCEPTVEWREISRATLEHPSEPGTG